MTPYKGMSFVLLVTILIVNIFALPAEHSDLIIEPRAGPAPEPMGIYDPCPFGDSNSNPREYTLTASWCLDKKTVQRKCVQNEGDPPDIQYYTFLCGAYSYCVGSAESDPDPRWARCEVNIKRGLRWVTNKLKNSAVLQCAIFQSNSVTGADGLGVQVENPAPGSNPPMPQEAQLFYQGASYPIQAMDQSTMNDLSGYFIFNNVIDYSQTLQICLNVASLAIAVDFGLINPKSSNLGDSSFGTEIEIVYRTFDDAAGVWKEVQLEVEE